MDDGKAKQGEEAVNGQDKDEVQPVDGPGGDEGPGGLGSTSQGSPGEAEGGESSGS